ncbi:MAG: 30S ribosomal protein S16 [Minisyncoccia bacterium]
MLRIRLSRVGKKNTPIYKVVVAEKTRPVKGKFIESLGMYNPGNKDNTINVERTKYWISVGAQPSQTVYNLLIKNNIIEGNKIAISRAKVKESK